MLTPSDVLRAAGLGVRLEIDEPLVTDWRALYVDQRRITWEHEQTIERWRDRARMRLVRCRVMYGLWALTMVAAIWGWWR